MVIKLNSCIRLYFFRLGRILNPKSRKYWLLPLRFDNFKETSFWVELLCISVII